MNDEDLREELKRLRTQGRSRVIVLVASLILIFLWFTNFSWVTGNATFSSAAMAALARYLGMRSFYIIPVTFIITVLYTIFYILLMKILISTSTKDLKQRY
ncbi:MAG: hypothetical protein ACFFEO_14250 [Candidatus Thorarchaeota archaeon]